MQRLVAHEQTSIVEETLPLPDHAVAAIVEEQYLDRNAIRAGGFEFAHVHADAAVTVDIDHERIRPCELRADRGGQAEAHRAHAARCKKAPRPDEVEELRGPHLMLSDTRADDRPATSD